MLGALKFQQAEENPPKPEPRSVRGGSGTVEEVGVAAGVSRWKGWMLWKTKGAKIV